MSDNLKDNLQKRAKVWAGNITKIAHRNLGKFRKLIVVHSRVEDKGDTVGISSVATPTNSLKPVARAYEYGSGVHSRLSRKSPKQIAAKGKILIKPVRARVLAFHWEVADANPDKFIFLEDGRVILPSVKHPGVEAANGGRGYLGPAVNEVRKQVRKEIPKEARDAVLATFRKAFRKA